MMKDEKMQKAFRYLFERLNEPLGMGVKGGSDQDMVYYEMPKSMMGNYPNGPDETLKSMGFDRSQSIKVQEPKTMPMEQLKMVASNCPKGGLFGYFIPEHRQALLEMRKILMSQKSLQDLFNMSCACRDSPMVHPHLFVNALAATLAERKDCRGFQMPAFHEIMPDLFINDQAIKQAEKMARVKDADKSCIMLDRNSTGDHRDPESKLWYFREDVGVNSHHFHWHVVFPGEWSDKMEQPRDRRGELFYYMHHSMIARYDAERLSNGLPRTKLFNFDEPILEEGYFGKLYSTNAGMHWGTRQANTRLRDLARFDVQNQTLWDVRVEDLKKWRDRILEAIDSGYIYRKQANGDDVREKLDETTGIDILGNIIENSREKTPHRQYYGQFGFHNMGHNVISFSHDPTGSHRETFGPMGDTSTAMRDPMFYRWHKYIDHMFIQYKNTLTAYQLTTGLWPLVWSDIEVGKIEVARESNPSEKNVLSTHWALRDINLARGLDFWRNSNEHKAPVWARLTFLDYSPFDYTIQVNNKNRSNLKATVRIFIAPTQDEHGELFRLEEQRNMFYELDKFVASLQPGMNTINRKSIESAVTVKQENLFHQLENLSKTPGRNDINTTNLGEDPACGCGWPQHLLITRGTPSGMPFDLFVIITDGRIDGTKDKPEHACRDAMSFCGIMDEIYPDLRPMGYPFDRLPYSIPSGTTGTSSTAVNSIQDYTKNIPNASTTRVTIRHDNSPPKLKADPSRPECPTRMVDERGQVMVEVQGQMQNKNDKKKQKPSGTPKPQGMVNNDRTGKTTNNYHQGGQSTSNYNNQGGGGWIANYNQAWPPPPRPFYGRSDRDAMPSYDSWEHLDDDDDMQY